MTIPFLIDDLKQDEGCRLQAYPDPKSGGAPWTIGYGATGEMIGPGAVWTQAEADADLARRCQALEGRLDHALPWWRTLNPVRQAVIANMAYNLGVAGLLGFQHMLAAARAGGFDRAADEMLANGPGAPTQWALDVGPRRSGRLAEQMRSGARAGHPLAAPRTLADADWRGKV